MTPCPYCSNPIKEFYMTQCKYIPTEGEDAPCAVDAYYEKLKKDSEKDVFVAKVTIGILVIGIIVLALIFA